MSIVSLTSPRINPRHPDPTPNRVRQLATVWDGWTEAVALARHRRKVARARRRREAVALAGLMTLARIMAEAWEAAREYQSQLEQEQKP